jgi:Ni/Fe-hydrogenase subunit HybB-like protein
MLACALIVFGVVINRWNVTLSGLVAPPDWSPGVLGDIVVSTYLPSGIEVMVALGILAYALLGFTLAVRYLHVFDRH